MAKNGTLLWIDDEIELLRAHILFLKGKEYEVDIATNGRDALDRCRERVYDLILLDEHGQERRSIEYAQWIQKKMAAGRDIIFVIGGPYGFSPAVYERANNKISLSQMTFSHQMIRLLFVEQLYRAMTILRGEPYHHESPIAHATSVLSVVSWFP